MLGSSIRRDLKRNFGEKKGFLALLMRLKLFFSQSNFNLIYARLSYII